MDYQNNRMSGMGGKFVSHRGFRIWVDNSDVQDVTVQGKQTTFDQQATAKYALGCLNLPVNN